MEMAIDMMRRSVAESRIDEKKSPAVGAVLVQPDGAVASAFRGELRDGDHAEYTLLERKNRDKKLDGSTLYATLEPCAPGSRNSPKLGCAERIVLARIKKVWIGIEDPDPKVDRKGIEYLRRNGVEVQMFDRDLQVIIRQVNKGFIDQALQRKAEAKKEKAILLSPLEKTVLTADLKDFSIEALKRYKSVARIPYPIQSEGFNRLLLQLGLLHTEAKKLVPTGFGLLLFGKSPRTVMPQAGLLGTIHYPGGKIETRDFDGPLVRVPEEVENWLRNKLPNTIDRSRMQRRQSSDLPFELIREAIVNALVHRDYDIKGAKCQLIVTEDTLIVKSPGGPTSPITLAQLQTFNAPMLSRNPVLHYVFSKLELAEERGLGLNSLKSRSLEMKLPLPRYAFNAPYLDLTLYRNAAGAVKTLGRKVTARLNPDETESLQWITAEESATTPDLMDVMGFDERKAQRVMGKLLEAGLVRRIGKGPATRYEAIR